jgi:hypothetical protein
MMKKRFTQKTIDIIQWVLIIGLIAMLAVQGANYRQVKKDLVTAAEYNKENTYIRIYESQKLNKLKRENRELYDSISKLRDVESGMVIKFREHYNTDTIKADKFIVQRDTVRIYADDNVYEQIDSIYHYAQNNDTVNLNIDVKAKQLQWMQADFTINDKFMIINREKDGVNQTLISHSDNATIEGTAMWHRQEAKKWYQRFTVSPQVGAGYGIVNKKFDVYVGIGVGYQVK